MSSSWIAGVQRFQHIVYPKAIAKHRKLVRERQKPHTRFITCADSRIDPELTKQSGPGEIFVSRNVGNLVPPSGEVPGVECAVAALHVSHLVVCGHTDCGAMIGLLHPEKVMRLPTVESWLRNGEAAFRIVRQRGRAPDEHSALEQLIEENVLLQLHHLRTHPSVAGSLAAQTLALSGWVFDIAHGMVRIQDEKQHKFIPVSSDRPVTSRPAG
jgi:carbonic anhydrase